MTSDSNGAILANVSNGLGLHKQSMSLYQMFQKPGPEKLKLQFWSFQSQNAIIVGFLWILYAISRHAYPLVN